MSGEPTVRTARFDRPLGSLTGLGWTDPTTERLVREAVEQGRAAGQAQGYAAGWAQGRRAAAEAEAAAEADRERADAARRAQEAAQVQRLLTTLGQAARRLDQSLAPAWTEIADVITDGVLHLVGAILARELEAVPAPVLESVRTALHTLGDCEQTLLRLHPDDLAVVTRAYRGQAPDGVRLVADDRLEPGQVAAAGPVQHLRTSLPAAIAAAEEVLRS